MKFFATIVICAVFAVGVLAAPEPSPEPSPAPEPAMKRDIDREMGLQQYDPAFVHGNSDLLRLKKSYAQPAPSYAAPAPSYGPSRISYAAPAPSIPCSRAIVVSCAPSVIPAPCSAPPAHGYGY